MSSTGTTFRKVANYVERLDDVEELQRIAKLVESRRREVLESRRLSRCRERLEVLASAGWIVRDRENGDRIFFGAADALYSSPRWYVRGRHDGRKYVGLWVTRTPDEPRGRKTSVFLPLEDAILWKPEPAT